MIKSYSIGKKILAGFSVLIFLFSINFLVILFSINRAQNISENLLIVSKNISSINVLYNQINNIEKNIDSFYITPYEQYFNEINKSFSEVNKEIKNIYNLNDDFGNEKSAEEIVKLSNDIKNLQKKIDNSFSSVINNQLKDHKSLSAQEIVENYKIIDRIREDVSLLSLTLSNELKDTQSKQSILYRNIFVVYILFWIVSIFFSVYLSIKLSRNIASPITELRNASEEIAKRNFDYSIKKRKTDDEISDLIEVFNNMIEELNIADKKIRGYNNDLEAKVHEKTKELNKKVKELENLNRFMVDREEKIISLKKEIGKLKDANKNNKNA